MVNLQSKNQELIEELTEEIKHVQYWHRKYYGGRHRYDKWQDEQIAKLNGTPAGTEHVGDIIDYHSLTTGNRWKTFEVTTSYGDGGVYTRSFQFCYWETYGSVGAFLSVHTIEKQKTILVFPSHFFQRYAERLGLKHRDAALVTEFFVRNNVTAIKFSEEKDEKGRRQIVIAAKEGACYGVTRSDIDQPDDMYDKDNVYEVRTFLKYDQLSGRQAKEVEELKSMAEDARELGGAPVMHAVGRVMGDKSYGDKMVLMAMRRLNLTKKQYDYHQRFLWQILTSTDFVSHEYGNSIRNIASNKMNGKANLEVCRLVDLIAEFIRCNPSVTESSSIKFSDLLELIRKWKGEDYDWNKWLWSFCNNARKNKECTDEDAKLLDDLQAKCVQGGFVYESIKAMFMMWDMQM